MLGLINWGSVISIVLPRSCSSSKLMKAWRLSLFQLLGHGSVLHAGGHHSEEEAGQQRADVEGDPWHGMGEEDLSIVPVHRPHDLVGQTAGSHAVSVHLTGDVWNKTGVSGSAPKPEEQPLIFIAYIDCCLLRNRIRDRFGTIYTDNQSVLHTNRTESDFSSF